MNPARLFLSSAIALGLAGAAAPALAATSTGAAIEALEPGEFVWTPERAEDGPVELVISLGLQRAWVFRDGVLIGGSTISSGKAGHESPVGRFQILEKKRTHRSNRYNDAPMPFMQRLNWYGVALHGGEVPGVPASHGCIRLPHRFAALLFEATERGSFVFVTDEVPDSPEQALRLARAHADMPVPPDRLPRTANAA